jgi:hypothetical protein
MKESVKVRALLNAGVNAVTAGRDESLAFIADLERQRDMLLEALQDVACACEGRMVVPVADFLAVILNAIARARGEQP